MRLMSLIILLILISVFNIKDIHSQSFTTGEIEIDLNYYGRIRVLKQPEALRQIDRSSIIAGVDSNYVFSYLLSSEPEDTMKLVENPIFSDFEIYGSINNTYDTTGQSPDFLVKHNAYGWNGGGYALVKFTVINRESVSHNAVLGMEVLSQINEFQGFETINYLPDSEIISVYRSPSSTYVGYKVLSHNMPTLRSFEWYSGYNLSNSDLYNWLTYTQIDTIYDAGANGAVSIFAINALNITPGDSVVFWVGISIGENDSAMVTNMALANARYGTIITEVENNNPTIPSVYELKQNYPNPFNPSTTIQFLIAETEFVSLKVYDVLGTEIAELINQSLTPGRHEVQFNSNSLSSGIYFYQLISGEFSETKKMTLIK